MPKIRRPAFNHVYMLPGFPNGRILWPRPQARPPTPARSALRVTRREAADSGAATARRAVTRTRRRSRRVTSPLPQLVAAVPPDSAAATARPGPGGRTAGPAQPARTSPPQPARTSFGYGGSGPCFQLRHQGLSRAEGRVDGGGWGSSDRHADQETLAGSRRNILH